MNHIVTFAAAAVLALSAGGIAAAATPTSSNLGAVHLAKAVPTHLAPGSTVLYDQTADDSGIALVSQNFESNYDIYDSAGADDFVVPKGAKWTVTEVDVVGQYFNGSGPAVSENVSFYTVKKGFPKKLVATFTSKGKDSGTGSFAIKLKKGVKLKAGTYAVSVQVNMDFSNGGEWGWENTATVQTGSPAAWENPGDGFGTGCTTWGVEDACIAAGQGPDHIFKLIGKAK